MTTDRKARELLKRAEDILAALSRGRDNHTENPAPEEMDDLMLDIGEYLEGIDLEAN